VKTELIGVRVTEQERKEIELAARIERKSLSAFVRERALQPREPPRPEEHRDR
jgi:uncharacterized protein (DUF1778 family)